MSSHLQSSGSSQAIRAETPCAVFCVALIGVLVASGCGKTTITNVTINPPPPAAAPNVAPVRIPSGSMEPTLSVGDHVWFEELVKPPRVGDIILFHPPTGAQEGNGEPQCGPSPHVVVDGTAACAEPVPSESPVKFIKRIVAGPGDVISIVEGHMIRNGVREPDAYTRPCAERESKCNFPTPIRIPPDHWFVLGDNRGDSDDSRFWGPVEISWILGRARWCKAIGTVCAGG
jgi:signal peptidase I